MQAHPRTSTSRTRSAFKNLDSLIQSLSLTMLDIADSRTTIFLPGQVPIVPSTTPMSSAAAPPLFDYDNVAPGLAPPAVYLRQHGLVPGHSHAHSYTPPANDSQWQCGCSSYSLGNNWPLSVELAPAWTCTPMWPDSADEGEMQKEECRRLVWSTVMLTASHNTKTTAGTDREPHHLWIKDPANVGARLGLEKPYLTNFIVCAAFPGREPRLVRRRVDSLFEGFGVGAVHESNVPVAQFPAPTCRHQYVGCRPGSICDERVA